MNDNKIKLSLEHQGRTGECEFHFGRWSDSTIPIRFRDHLYDNSGVIRFDGRSANATITSERPYEGPLTDPARYTEYFSSILTAFSNAYTFGWSPDADEMVTYDETYHRGNNYTEGNETEISIKEVQVQIIRELADPEKCLVAGCSNGELVRQGRGQGLNAYGFDVIPNVKDIALPGMSDYLRPGSLTDIPYDVEDGFDTLVAVDVLEHIPERDLPRVIGEWQRMGFGKLVLLINLNQFWFPGHITLRPLDWWASQWKDHFTLARTVGRVGRLPRTYSNDGRYNQQWTLWQAV